MLVCSQCSNKDPCTREDHEVRAWLCRPGNQTGSDLIKFSDIITAEWHEYIPGDDLYSDPVGQPYRGISEYIQTPIIDPMRPATAAELMMRKKEQEIPQRYKLRDDK